MLGAEERTDTDKKRERRKKKTRQRSRKFARENKQKEMLKLNPGLGNKYSKQRVAKEIEKATKEGTIGKVCVNLLCLISKFNLLKFYFIFSWTNLRVEKVL